MMSGILVWVTGLAGAGKTTIATRVHQRLKEHGRSVAYLDGDTLRGIVGPALGHTREDRRQLCLRYSALCKTLTDQGIDVVCAAMCLLSDIQEHNRATIPRYLEVLVECSMNELFRRDQKGIYSKALRGDIKDVMGVDLPYDRPTRSHIVIDNTESGNLEHHVDTILDVLNTETFLRAPHPVGIAP